MSHELAAMISASPSLATATVLLQAAQLPTEDLTEGHCRHFFLSGTAESPKGLVGLEPFGDVALLRSLVVVPDMRGMGLGIALLKHAENAARASGVAVLYLLTTSAEEFFARRGYARTARENAPTAIRTTREFAGICPASSAFMSRNL